MFSWFKKLFKKKCEHIFDTVSIIEDDAVVMCSKCGKRK